MWWLNIPIIDTQNIQGPGGGLAPDTPVFHSGVDCPANVWSAIRSCPNLAQWIILVGVGGLLVGYYIGRR